MNIVFITSYFYPEQSSSDYLLFDKLNALRTRGHKCIVITPNPIRNLEKKEIQKYKKIPFEVDSNGTEIHRVYVGFNNVKSKIMRFIRSFISMRKIIKKAKEIESDVISVGSGAQSSFVRNLRKAVGKNKKIIYRVYDIYPDIVVRSGFLYKYLNKRAIESYNSASKIIVLSHDMKNTLIKKSVPENKITIIPIWTKDVVAIEERVIKEKYNIKEDKTNVFYIGNIGEWQNIDTIIDSFQLLDDHYVQYLVGGGRLENHIRERVGKINSDRLIYIKSVPIEEAHALYKIADINLITLNKSTIFYAYPSKTSICIQAKKQIIAMVDSDSEYAKKIKNEYGAVITKSFSASSLSEAIYSVKLENRNNYNYDAAKQREEALNSVIKIIGNIAS